MNACVGVCVLFYVYVCGFLRLRDVCFTQWKVTGGSGPCPDWSIGLVGDGNKYILLSYVPLGSFFLLGWYIGYVWPGYAGYRLQVYRIAWMA